ncbi:MAG: hypothetical protein R6X02_08755 [Enhygromyxa sp.]
MRLAHETPWPEQQMVHRLFTIRWTPGCVHTLLHGTLVDDPQTRRQIDAWAGMLAEIIPELGGEFVSIIDASALGQVPRSLWFELVKLTRGMVRKPARRALIAAEGSAGDNQAETAQLVTAGSVRVFRPDQFEDAIDWVSGAGTIEGERLRLFLS